MGPLQNLFFRLEFLDIFWTQIESQVWTAHVWTSSSPWKPKSGQPLCFWDFFPSTPADTASRKTRNSEGGNGQGSAALLSDPPISNHSRALGGGAKLRRAAHAEVPSAKLDLVNIPIKENITQPRLDNSDNVWSRGAVEKVPEKQILERSKPEKNNPPNLGPKNVKMLELQQPPRLIKKARRQKKSPSFRNEDQLSIKKFLERVPTPDKSSSRTGVLKKVYTGVKLSKRKFTGSDEILREVKFMKLGESDAPHNGGRVGEDKTHPILGNEGTTLKNGTNIQSDISKQNSDIEPESLLKIKCENDLITPRQIIAPITAINPKIKGGYSFHVVSG